MDVDPRRRFREKADGVGPAPLGDIVSRGTHLRRRRRTAVAGTVALVLLAAGVVGYQALRPAPKVQLHVLTTPSMATSPKTTTPSLTPSQAATAAPTPAATALTIADSTWVSDREGWVVGAALCNGAPCTAILHTADGGSSWARVNAPAVPPTQGGGIQHIRFATPSIGYAYGSGNINLYMTTDGARSWQSQAPTDVEDLEISGGTAYAIATTGSGCPFVCNADLEASAVGTTTWRSLHAPAISEGVGENVVVQGMDVYYIAYGHTAGGIPDAQSRIARSADGGGSWQTLHDPCGPTPSVTTPENDAVSLAAAPSGFVGVMCTPRGNVDQAFLVTSHDAGAVFGPHLPAPSGTRLVAGSATALALGGRGGVNVSHDGGVTWHETLQGTGGPTFLGFEDATTARASFGNGTLYTTTDAGDTWSTSSPAG